MCSCRPASDCWTGTHFVTSNEQATRATRKITIMNTRFLGFAASLALITGITGNAHAADPHDALPQLAGATTDLGSNASALTYWVDEADGLHVVTTIDTIVGGTASPEPDRHAIVRFSALILPGQSQVISVPGVAGSQTQALRIRRLRNHDGLADIQVDSIPLPKPYRENSSLIN